MPEFTICIPPAPPLTDSQLSNALLCVRATVGECTHVFGERHSTTLQACLVRVEVEQEQAKRRWAALEAERLALQRQLENAPQPPNKSSCSTVELEVPRPPPVHTASFSRLCSIEVQLILQCCERDTFLPLATTSKFINSCAQQPFAWAHLSVVWTTEQLMEPAWKRTAAEERRRRCPAIVHISHSPYRHSLVFSEEADSMFDLSNIRELCLVGLNRTIPHQTMHWLLAHPSLARLQVLTIEKETDAIQNFIQTHPTTIVKFQRECSLRHQ